jgi:hypothetical protein
MIERLKAALAALEMHTPHYVIDREYPPITDLRAVIAEMEAQQPVAWGCFDEVDGSLSGAIEFESQPLYVTPLYTHPQPKAEPADMGNPMSDAVCKAEPAAAPQAKPQPLTDEKVMEILASPWLYSNARQSYLAFARAIEAAHGIGGEHD